MDNIWYRNPSKSEIIGRGGDENNERPRRTERSRTLKKIYNYLLFVIYILIVRGTLNQAQLSMVKMHSKLYLVFIENTSNYCFACTLSDPHQHSL